jgi:hypothetical protein
MDPQSTKITAEGIRRLHGLGWEPRREIFANLRHLWILLVLLVPLAASPAQAASALRQVPAVIHVHSTWSSGDETLDALIARARNLGVEAVFLAENHLQRFEYGVPPLRNLLRYRVEYPSLLSRGPEPFLQAVQAANARQQDVVLIPGAEVIPHYYWTGSLLGGTLTMHNGQKNILALGLLRPEDYRNLPAVGNGGAARFGPATAWLLSPALLAVPGVWLLRRRRQRVVQLRYCRLTVERRFTGYGTLCLTIGALFLANNFPFRVFSISPYDSGAGLKPHQAVIDFVNARGGFAVWSLPEARDHQVIAVAGMRATIHTDPYPSDLSRTDRFTAFGGIYEDTTTFTEPGGDWDFLLADYLSGRRARPAWALGEAAYHREGQAGKRFGTVQTVFLVERKDPSALMEALRAGRFYALARTPEVGLILDQFQVLLPGRPSAEAGDRVNLRASDRAEVAVAIRATGGQRIGIQARLVRDGAVVHALRGETPLTFRWSDSPLAGGASRYYRLDVRGPAGHQILSNPIFARGAEEGSR